MRIIVIDDVKDITDNKMTIRYGGCAKIVVNCDILNQEKCYKIYHSSFKAKKRKIVKDNYIKQSAHPNLIKKAPIILPDTLYVDENNNLIASRMKNHPYGNLMNAKYKHFYSKDYHILLTNFLNGVKSINEAGLVMTDLKESNVLVDHNLKHYFIDNDFTFFSQDEELIKNKNYLSNIFGKAYLNTFGEESITKNFNNFAALYITAKLLLEEDKIEELVDSRGRFTLKSLLSIQRFIQTDKSFSCYLRKVFKNLTTADESPIINDDIIHEVKEHAIYKYKKRH